MIVVEDTEGFDTRVLADLLWPGDAGDVLPVCVLLGVATSTAMMHGMIPRRWRRDFALVVSAAGEIHHDGGAGARAVDPGRARRCPTPRWSSSTRFKEHDFSLSAARRACISDPRPFHDPTALGARRRRRRRRRVRRSRRRRRRRAWNFVVLPRSASRTSTRTSPRSLSRVAVTAEAATAARAAAPAACAAAHAQVSALGAQEIWGAGSSLGSRGSEEARRHRGRARGRVLRASSMVARA